jgi:Outer membrane protein beta-barrel domain
MKPIVLALLLCSAAFAQKIDLALLGGGQISLNPNTSVGVGGAIQGNFGYRIAHVPTLSLYAELPITSSFGVGTGLPAGLNEFSTLFVTPGVRLKITPPVLSVSPYFTLGFGWARYQGPSGSGFSNTTDAVQFGVGTDVPIVPFLALRTEVRDYYTGAPGLGPAFRDRQHNLTALGGLVLHF